MKSHNELTILDLIVLFQIIGIYVFTSTTRVVVEIVFVCSYLLFYTKNSRLGKNVYAGWFVFFLVFCFLSIFWSWDSNASVLGSRGVFEVAIPGICIFDYSNRPHKFKRLVSFFLYASIALIIQILITVPLTTILSGRLGSNSSFNANTVALKLAFASIFVFSQLQDNRTISRFFQLLFIYGSFIVIIVSGSRKGILSFMYGIFIIYYYCASRNKRILVILSAGLFSILFYYMIMEIPQLNKMIGIRIEAAIKNTFGFSFIDPDGSIGIRSRMALTALDIWKEHFWLGAGINTYQYLGGFATYSHNNYTELLAGVGLLGFCAYYSIFVIVLIRFLSKKKILNVKQNVATGLLLFFLFLDFYWVTYGDEFAQLIIPILLSRIYSFSTIK